MIKEGKFGVSEAIYLTTITISSKVFFTSPGFLTRFVGTAGWYMTLVSSTTAILAFTFVYLLLKRFPDKNIIEIFDISLGRSVGFVFSLLFAAAFLHIGGTVIREFVDVMKVFVFPLTPPSILIGAFVAVVVVASFLGLESIARVSKLTGFIMLILYCLVLLFSVQNFRLTNIFPILGYGLDKTIIHGLRRSSAYDEIMVLAVFAGSLQGIKHVKKAGYISLALSGLIISVGLLSFQLVFPYQVSQELTAPIYVLARLVKYGAFFQRLDPIFLFLWNVATMITVSVLFYSAVSTYCKMFRLRDTRPVIFPMAVLLFAIAITPKDFPSLVGGLVQRLREYGWVVFYVLPIIALVTAVLRKKKGEKSIA